jgi:hypothetical protein
MTLFDQQDLAEITHPDYPGERLIACRNPLLAAERTRKRDELLAATEALLAPVAAAVAAGKLHGAAAIGLKVGPLINKYKMAKHFQLNITDTSLTIARDTEKIAAEAALDGIYVLRTSVPADQLDAPGVVIAYKQLSYVERDFRHIKADDLALRPIHHRLEDRVRAHVLLCMLAYNLTWHLKAAWAPLLFADEDPPINTDPVAKATRSAHAEHKAQTKRTANGEPCHSYKTLLADLATLTRNTIRPAGTTATFHKNTEPTPLQRRALDLAATAPVTT